jgi:hypothetical protein
MTEQLLFPRLNNIGVQELFPVAASVNSSNLDLHIESAPAFISWGATGGRRVTEKELLTLRSVILKLAEPLGFPRHSSQLQRAEFDAACSSLLAERGVLPVGEALRDDVWAYLTTVLLPDVAFWRFPDPPVERFSGGVRNTFQRLWLRARAFDRGPGHAQRWQLLSELSEDAMVQVTERPSISSDSRLSLAIAESWLKTARKIGKTRMEAVTREAVRKLRITNEVLYLAALDSSSIESSTIDYFDKAAAAK